MNTPCPPVSSVSCAAGPGGRGRVVVVAPDEDVVPVAPLAPDERARLPLLEQAARVSSATHVTIVAERVVHVIRSPFDPSRVLPREPSHARILIARWEI
jgi:hypothetical protein